MSGFKSATKRKRELAKQDKRQAKDQRRAQRRAARSGTGDESAAAVVAAVQPAPSNVRTLAAAPPAAASTPKPLTLAEAVERWRNTKVAKPPKRG